MKIVQDFSWIFFTESLNYYYLILKTWVCENCTLIFVCVKNKVQFSVFFLSPFFLFSHSFSCEAANSVVFRTG